MTALNGFLFGAIAGLALRLGIVRVTFDIATIFIAIGAVITLYRHLKRRSMINPTSDGFITGFCWVYGVLNLLEMPYSVPPS